MYYNGKNYRCLSTFVKAKKKEWFKEGKERGHTREYDKKYWESEGIVWAVQEYYGSMGEFSEKDVKFIEQEFGQWAGDLIDDCENDC